MVSLCSYLKLRFFDPAVFYAGIQNGPKFDSNMFSN